MNVEKIELPYEFKDKERKISFKQHDMPQPWINYLSNGRMHAFVSQAGGGMCWWRTTQNYRITRYRFYNLPIDSPGFYIYIRMQDGTVWSPTFRPCETKLDYWEASHSTGYSEFTAEKDGLKAILRLFMAMDSDTFIWDLKLENKKNVQIDCDIFAYTEFSQLAFSEEVKLGYYLKWNVDNQYDEDLNAIMYKYTSWMQVDTEKTPVVYFASEEACDSFCCNRDAFCGSYRDERNPIEVERGRLSNSNMIGGEACGALHHHIVLGADEKKQMHYFLGVTPGGLTDAKAAKEKTRETLGSLRRKDAAEEQFEKNIDWWEKHLSVYQCKIPDQGGERQINLWNPMQSVVTARYSRSISSTASGIRGIGFRDSAQDMLAQAYRKPEWAKDMLFYLCTQQHEDGHAIHACWPEDNKLPQELMRSDDHIWLVYLAYAIVAETGDVEFLNTKLPFLAEDLKTQVNPASVWEHLLRGVDFTEKHLGAHGLPLILFSDWNDHVGPFGRKGKGETVFVSQQHILALRQLTELAEICGREKETEYFKELIEKQEEALETYAWDGKWYLRGMDDDGKPFGSASSDYAKIWVNTQSWMIFSETGEIGKNMQAMDSVREMLDTGMGLLINTPALPEEKANSLPAGYSENGGIFCQANCWAIIAEALLGRGDIAWKYYCQLLPNEVIKKIGVERYKAEPYAYSSTMLGPDNENFGQACVSQVTGTAAWMDIASTQYILGIRPTVRGLLIDPSIPSDWKEYSVERKYRGCLCRIHVENPGHVQHGIKSICMDGKMLEGNVITPKHLAGKEETVITVIMG